MGTNVDELNITINVNSASAVTGIDDVIKKVKELSDVAGKGNFDALKGLAESLTSLGTAAKKIANIDFTPLTEGIKQLNRANVAAFADKANQLEDPLYRLGDASGYFGSRAKRAGDGAQSVAKAIKEFNGIEPSALDKMEPFFSRLSGMLEMMPKGVGKDLDLLAGSFYTLPEAMSKFMPPTEQGWDLFTGFIKRMAPLLAEFKDVSDGGAIAFHHLADGMKRLAEVSQEPMLAENFRKVADAVREFIQIINSSVNDTDLQRFSQIAQALYQVTEAYNHLKTAEQKAAQAPVAKNAARVQKILNSFTSNLKKSASQVVAFGKRVAMFVTTPFRNFGSAILGIGKAIKGLFTRFGRLALLRFMRSMIMKITQSLQEGIKNLYAWSTAVGHSFSQAMDTISTAGLYFKNSIAAMFSPLLEAIAPILDAIVDRVVAFINVINQLFALLTGKTVYTAAIKSAKAYGDAAGGAAAAQEELNRTVLGFDELNRLNGPDNDGGGGGGGASGGEGMFEVRDISDLAERLFKDDDWTWLGDMVTTKLTEQMQKLDWDKIQASANGIARRVGTFLNGAFENKEFWQTLGTTVGEGINTVTGFIDTFFDTTEWEELGDSFAEFLRNGISTIDWAQLGQTITDVPSAITKMLHGFVENWGTADWEMLGDSIAEMINNAFFNIDWETAIPDVVEVAKGILHAINTAIEGIEWEDMFEEIRKGVMGADWKGLWSELWEFIKNTAPVWSIMLGIAIGKAFVTTATSVVKNAIISAISSKVAAAIGGSAAGGAGGAGAGAAGAAGAGAAIGGKLSGLAAGLGAIAPFVIPITIVAAATVVTVVASVKRAQRLNAIQNTAERDADQYRNALNEALSDGMIDAETYKRGMSMANRLEDLFWENQQRNPWDVFGTQFEQEADAITEGLSTILSETGYTAAHIHRNVNGKLSETFDATKKFVTDTELEFNDLKVSVTTDTGEMSTNTANHMRTLRDKSSSYLLSAKTDGVSNISELSKTITDKLSTASTNGTSHAETLRKNVVDKLSSANTNGASYIEKLRKSVVDKLSDAKNKGTSSVGDLTKNIDSKLSVAANNVSGYGGNVGQKFADGIKGKVGSVNSAVGNLTSSAGKLNVKDSAYVWGADMGQSFANGILSKSWAVENAAKSAANNVKKYLHFSEPDVGPLSDFHTYAPDMMRSFAQGIEANKQLVVDQLQSATSEMRGVFTGVGVNYSMSAESNYDGLIAALADREEPINVYIGNSKLDTVIARSGKRTDLRTGGR